MAKTKITACKSTGPHGVPRHQLAPRDRELGEGSSKTLGDEGSSSNPANIENLTKELNTLRRAQAKDQEKLAEMERVITMTMEHLNLQIIEQGSLSNIAVESTIKDQIIAAQQKSKGIAHIKDKVRSGRSTCFKIDESDVV